MAVRFKIIKGTTNPFSSYTPHDVAQGSQDFLICVEMFVAAIAHHLYSYRDFTTKGVDSAVPFLDAFAQVSNPNDVVQDIRTNLPMPKPPDVKLPRYLYQLCSNPKLAKRLRVIYLILVIAYRK